MKITQLAEKTIDKIWDRVNGSDADEKTYWAVLNIIQKYREKKALIKSINWRKVKRG